MSMVHFSTAMRYLVFLEKLDIAIVASIFLDLRERLFFDYFAHFRTDYFGIIHALPPPFPKAKTVLLVCCSNTIMGQVRDTCTEDRNWTTVRMCAPATNMRWRRGVGGLLHGCRRCIISNNSLEGKKEVNSSGQLEIISTLNSVVNST